MRTIRHLWNKTVAPTQAYLCLVLISCSFIPDQTLGRPSNYGTYNQTLSVPCDRSRHGALETPIDLSMSWVQMVIRSSLGDLYPPHTRKHRRSSITGVNPFKAGGARRPSNISQPNSSNLGSHHMGLPNLRFSPSTIQYSKQCHRMLKDAVFHLTPPLP